MIGIDPPSTTPGAITARLRGRPRRRSRGSRRTRRPPRSPGAPAAAPARRRCPRLPRGGRPAPPICAHDPTVAHVSTIVRGPTHAPMLTYAGMRTTVRQVRAVARDSRRHHPDTAPGRGASPGSCRGSRAARPRSARPCEGRKYRRIAFFTPLVHVPLAVTRVGYLERRPRRAGGSPPRSAPSRPRPLPRARRSWGEPRPVTGRLRGSRLPGGSR